MTAGEWDTHEWSIFNDAVNDGHTVPEAQAIAARECVEQFGDRPDEETAK